MISFSFLAGISPWWWVAFAVALGAVEMATMSFFLIWPALAAFVMALLLVVAPGTSGEIQISLFAILAIALTFAGRSLVHRFGDGGEATGTLNARSTLMIGRHAEVQSFTGPEGNVTVDGIRWRAHWPTGKSAKPGDTVKVTGANGMVLMVEAEN